MSRFQSLANSIPPMNASFSLSVIFPLHNIFILHFLQSDKSFFELKVITIHAHIEYFLIVDNVCLDELCLCCRPALIDEHSLDCLFYHFTMGLFLLCRWRCGCNHFLIRIVNRSCNEFFPTLVSLYFFEVFMLPSSCKEIMRAMSMFSISLSVHSPMYVPTRSVRHIREFLSTQEPLLLCLICLLICLLSPVVSLFCTSCFLCSAIIILYCAKIVNSFLLFFFTLQSFCVIFVSQEVNNS